MKTKGSRLYPFPEYSTMNHVSGYSKDCRTHTNTHIYIYKEACKLVCLWIQLVYHRAEVMAYDSLKAATNNSRAFHIQTFKVILASLVSASHRP